MASRQRGDGPSACPYAAKAAPTVSRALSHPASRTRRRLALWSRAAAVSASSTVCRVVAHLLLVACGRLRGPVDADGHFQQQEVDHHPEPLELPHRQPHGQAGQQEQGAHACGRKISRST